MLSQSQTLTGTIKDSLGEPLQNANVIAAPLLKEKGLKFSIADHLGRYKLQLEKNVTYEVTVSYIGYIEQKKEITLQSNNEEYFFVLQSNNQKLNEITLNYEYKPIIVKKDTLIYDVAAFAKGNERKMKEILEKLPGVEVDKNGTVTVQGKKVTKMMVEGKSFFGGGSKLAVENIPSDALDKIEVIDNFNEVGFLKQVSDSDDLAMNVKLKADKKKFVFGDVQVGAEVANDNGFYLAHTALFYYSPKTNISFIGDANSIGKNTFTFQDMMRFQGGASSFITGRKSLTNLYQFTSEKNDVVENKSQFSALNFSQALNSKLDINGFIILSKQFTKSYQTQNNQYLQNAILTNEIKTNTDNSKNTLAISNFKLDYSPNNKEKWYYNSQFNLSGNDTENSIISIRNTDANNFQSLLKGNNFEFKEFLEWHKQYNQKHTTTFVVNHQFNDSKLRNNWFTNTPFLSGLIPIQNDIYYDIRQVKNIKNMRLDALLKHYWILTNNSQLYSNLGNNLETTQIITSEKQYLSDKSTNDFENNGFGNSSNYLLDDFYFGLEFKIKIKKWINKPGIYTHLFHLKNKQFENTTVLNRLYLQPQWDSEYEFNDSESLKFKYRLENNFPDAIQMLERFSLQSYNTVVKGNALLQNEKFHNATLNYIKRSMYRGTMLFASLSYNKKTTTIRNAIQLDGINQFTTPILTDNPETSWRLNGSLTKKVKRFRLGLNTNLNGFNYVQNINDIVSTNTRNNQNLGVKISTATKSWPSISIAYNKGFSQFNGITNSKQQSDRFVFDLDLDITKNINFKTDYEINFNDNNGIKNFYRIANASLTYQKKNNPFLFELIAKNYLNNGTVVTNSFSDYLISSTTTFILPRIIMLSVNYKL